MEPETIKPDHVLRLIRCKQTGHYFGPEGWSPEAGGALNFQDTVDAVRACVEHRLSNVELVLRPPGATHDLFRTTIR